MPLITLQSVDYSVGGPLLLERVDLAIEPGERIALIGRNGAGKSTLLKLLSGELKPDDGEVRVEGGLPVPDDKLAVPKLAFSRLLALALNPPAESMRLPFTANEPVPAACYVSLQLRPLVESLLHRGN